MKSAAGPSADRFHPAAKQGLRIGSRDLVLAMADGARIARPAADPPPLSRIPLTAISVVGQTRT